MASCVYEISVVVVECSIPRDAYGEGQLLVDITATDGQRYIHVPSERQFAAGEVVIVESNDHDC